VAFGSLSWITFITVDSASVASPTCSRNLRGIASAGKWDTVVHCSYAGSLFTIGRSSESSGTPA
jgi:hypothetical protein